VDDSFDHTIWCQMTVMGNGEARKAHAQLPLNVSIIIAGSSSSWVCRQFNRGSAQRELS